MNLNNLDDIQGILEKAQEVISKEISKLPKDEQVKLNNLRGWAKTASIDELRDELNKQQQDAVRD